MMRTILSGPCRGAMLALALTVLGAGCSRATRATADQPPADQTAADAEWSGSVAITVTNRYALDMVVFSIISGQRQRLGLVTSATRQTFALPLRLLTGGRTLRLRAEPVGRGSEREIMTEALVVQPGQRVEWMLESGLERSTVGVY